MNLEINIPIKKKSDYRFQRNITQIRAMKDASRRTQTTEKPERVYFLWFLCLKLLLEMEEKGLGLLGGPKGKIRELIIGKDIKIDKKFYVDWELDDVRDLPFWKWWKGHKELFEPPSTIISDTPKGWKSGEHFGFVRVDLRNDLSTIVRDVQREFSFLKGKGKRYVSQFSVNGEPQYTNEILKYNLMVRKLNGEDDREIFENEKRRFKSANDGGESPFNPSSSKLWRFYGEYMKLSPKEREYSKKTVYRSQDSFKITDKGKYQRWARTEGFRIGRVFDSALRTEINRYISDYQKILNGVAKGMYRKPIKF